MKKLIKYLLYGLGIWLFISLIMFPLLLWALSYNSLNEVIKSYYGLATLSSFIKGSLFATLLFGFLFGTVNEKDKLSK